MGSRRVVATGISVVSPLGCDVPIFWDRLLKGQSGIKPVSRFDASDLNVQVAGEVPLGSGPGELDLQGKHSKDVKRKDLAIIYGTAAGNAVMEDSKFDVSNIKDPYRYGIYAGSGIGGIGFTANAAVSLDHGDQRSVPLFLIPGTIINIVAGELGVKYGFQGPNISIATACASSSHAIGEAYNAIISNRMDMGIVVGFEAPLYKVGMLGFDKIRALCKDSNDAPHLASRPWASDRSGFVMSEGAAALVLEDMDHALQRGAHIYGEISGYGVSCDSYHITAPEPNGSGGAYAMRQALGSVDHRDVSYVNAHATSTTLGDKAEVNAIRSVFGDRDVFITGNKSILGHTLGAAGAIEAIISLLSVKNNVIPKTINLTEESLDAEFKNTNIVYKKNVHDEIKHVISNSFGFGGTNCSLLISKYS